VTADNPKSPNPPKDRPVDSPEVEDFFQRLPGNFRWPKPNAESIAAAAEAIQRMSGTVAAQTEADEAGESGTAAQSRPAGQHHFHHHYHHFVPGAASAGSEAASGGTSAESETTAARGRAPGSPGISTGGRAEAGARKVVQDWAQACNTKHIDDLLELYSADATLIRSSVPPVRSLPAIREFLISLLEAGLGDVEMESLRLEMLGEIALDLGRCKMLVPVAMGKRREERGKYLVVLVRQPSGTWKILADCWSADLAVSAPPPEPAVRKGSEPVLAPRKPR
jgi:ketosteroid isomerase-like protein